MLAEDPVYGASYRQSLARIGPPTATEIPGLIRLLDHRKTEVGVQAARALAAFGPCADEAVPGLLGLLDKSWTRDPAVIALARIGRTAAPDLVRLLGEARGSDADRIAWALGEIGPEAAEVVPDLVRLLDTEHSFYALYVLAKIGPPAAAAVPKILPLLKNRNVADVTEPARVIDEATGDGLKWTRVPAAVEVLAAIGEPAVRPLLSALDDDDLALGAAWALAEIGPGAWAAVPRLVVRLRHPRTGTFAAVALGRIGRPTVPALEEALTDADPLARLRAAWALGEVGPAAAPALPALDALGNDPVPAVRQTAEVARTRIAQRRE